MGERLSRSSDGGTYWRFKNGLAPVSGVRGSIGGQGVRAGIGGQLVSISSGAAFIAVAEVPVQNPSSGAQAFDYDVKLWKNDTAFSIVPDDFNLDTLFFEYIHGKSVTKDVEYEKTGHPMITRHYATILTRAPGAPVSVPANSTQTYECGLSFFVTTTTRTFWQGYVNADFHFEVTIYQGETKIGGPYKFENAFKLTG